jgi:hypothetical protein
MERIDRRTRNLVPLMAANLVGEPPQALGLACFLGHQALIVFARQSGFSYAKSIPAPIGMPSMQTKLSMNSPVSRGRIT